MSEERLRHWLRYGVIAAVFYAAGAGAMYVTCRAYYRQYIMESQAVPQEEMASRTSTI